MARSFNLDNIHLAGGGRKKWEEDYDLVQAWFITRDNAWASAEQIGEAIGLSRQQLQAVTSNYKAAFEKRSGRGRRDKQPTLWRLTDEEYRGNAEAVGD